MIAHNELPRATTNLSTKISCESQLAIIFFFVINYLGELILIIPESDSVFTENYLVLLIQNFCSDVLNHLLSTFESKVSKLSNETLAITQCSSSANTLIKL